MKILKLDSGNDGFQEAVRSIVTGGGDKARAGWVVAPDNHGLKAPLLVKEYSSAETALADGCPPPVASAVLRMP